MFDSPLALSEYCLGRIRDAVPSDLGPAGCGEEEWGVFSSVLSSSQLTSNISEQLLTSLSTDGKLTDTLMLNVFESDNCRLESVKIPDASHLTKKGLRVLKKHNISHLEVVGLTKATINELIGCLGYVWLILKGLKCLLHVISFYREYSLNHLMTLNVSRSTFTSSARVSICLVFSVKRQMCHVKHDYSTRVNV